MGLYNLIVENIILPVSEAAIGSRFLKKLRYYRKVQWLPKEDLRNLQQDNLRQLLSFATKDIPFYKNIAFEPDADPFEEIRKFPVMKKGIIKENLDALVNGPKEQYIREASSGSSGIQGVVYLDKHSQSVQRSIQILWWEWAGYKLGNSVLQTGITPNRGTVKGIKDKLLKTRYVSAYSLDEKDIEKILMELQANPRQHFLGYASSLYVFAQVAKEKGINNIRFESAVSWGDKLFPHFRDLINSQFHTRVHNTYACTEGMMMAAECKHGNMHMMTPQVFMEILDENGNPVPNGQMGYVVVTRLDNYAMPLIRYYLGDLAVIDENQDPCPCGRALPKLKMVIGRDTDIVKTRSGKHMVVHAFTGIFEHISEIKQFKIIQENLDGIIIEYIKDEGFSQATLRLVEQKIHGYLNEKFPLEFREVEQIAPTRSGKPQIIQSFLNQKTPS